MGRILACLVFAWTLLVGGLASAAPVSVTVVEDSPTRTVLEYRIHQFDLVAKAIDGVQHQQVRLGREPLSAVAGEPALPVVHRSIIIDGDVEVVASVVASSYHDVPDVDVAPSRGVLTRGVHDPASEPYWFGPTYLHDAFEPAELVTLGEPYIFRDHRGVVVHVEPFQYNPVTRVLRVFDSLTVEIFEVGPGHHNVLGATPLGSSLSFHQMAAQHFLNHGTRAAYAPLTEQGEMLIIADDAFLPNVQELVEHKNAIGIPTTAVGVSTVGNSSQAIKSYIQNLYTSGNLAFVLLVGDASQVATPYASGGASDPSYAKVAGTDSYPDIMVGRFSASSAAHVDTQVRRTIDYEVGQATQQPWFKTGMGMASFEGPGDDGEYDNEHIENIRQKLLGYGFTAVDQVYGNGSPNDVISALNDGRGIVNYTGHGSPTTFGTTGFSNQDVPDISNTGKLPFVISVACNTGEFDTGTSLGEAMLRGGSASQPIGAVAMYASSISQSWNSPMAAQDEMIDRFVAETYVTLGAIAFAGSSLMMDEYGGDGVDMFNTWILFGDPSLRVVGTVEPSTGISVTPGEDLDSQGPVGGPFVDGALTYTVENKGEQAVELLVSSTAPWVTVDPAGGSIAAGASMTVSVAISDTATVLKGGVYLDQIQFINNTDHEGDTIHTARLTVGEPEQVLDFPMDENPGWEAEGDWAFGQPTGNGGQELGSPDPTGGHSGSNVYGYNLAGEYPNDMPEMSLTTTPIDCSELSRVSIKFWRWLNVEGSQYDHASVQVSADGQTWTPVWQNAGDTTDSGWVEQEFDISAIADGQAAVRVRWVMGASDGGLTASGWNIDDVSLWAFEGHCEDADGDGAMPIECGGADCDDSNGGVLPGATEQCSDAVDNDCDGAADGVDTDCGGTGTENGGTPDGGLGDNAPLEGEGCACSLGEQRRGQGASALALLGLALALATRRRRG